MNLRFALRFSLRDAASGARHLGIHAASIAMGVAALVSIHSFRADVTQSVEAESRSILGADVRLQSTRAFSDSVEAVLDSLGAAGVRSARVVDLPTMVYAEDSGITRLLQLRAVEAAFPFYSSVATQPAGLWSQLGEGESVLIDAPALLQLDVEVGDVVTIGTRQYRIAGTVDGLPTDLGLQAAVGPRVYLPLSELPGTGLLGFGSLARYQVYLELPTLDDVDVVDQGYRDLWRQASIRATTAEEQAEGLTDATQILTRFLGLVGLAALLLGGIGVASAAHAYVKGKVTTVAVLRCLGARQGTVFAAYLLQAAALGAVGSVVGVALGVVIQRGLPGMLGSVLPVEIVTRPNPTAMLVGLGVGIWVSVVFALLPLLGVLNVPPLRALRASIESAPRRGLRWLAIAALVVSILLLSVFEAPTPGVGIGFALGLSVTLALLWLTAWLATRATRRWFPSAARYPVRQGIANLFRPGNQTGAVTLALGFGAFVIGTMLVLQASLGAALSLDGAGSMPNLVLFDIQRDQTEGVLARVAEDSEAQPEVVPIVTAEIIGLKGRSVPELLADTTDDGPARWTLRRTYRNTYRAELTQDEELLEGTWFGGESDPDGARQGQGDGSGGVAAADGGPAAISVERSLADNLGVELGDEIVWSVQGVEVRSVVRSVRSVDWDQFRPNFFVVFAPGSLDGVPQTAIAFARVPDSDRRATLQTDLVRAFPNVSSLDVARIQEILDRVIGRVTGAIRFLAGIAMVGGLLVLIGALSTSRYERMREGAILKTLGARRPQILTMLFMEYAVLGVLAGLAGFALSLAAAAALTVGLFETDLVIPWVPVGLAWVVVAAATTIVGLAGSRVVLSRSPLASLRDPALPN